MKIEVEKSTLKELACIVQVVSILGSGMKITREMEESAHKVLDKLDSECSDLDLH